MPHRKLPSSFNRSVLGFTTAALLAGPFAATALAQVDVQIPPKPRADAILVNNVWVDPLTLEPIELASETVGKATETAAPVTKTVQDTVTKSVPTSDDPTESGGAAPAPVPGTDSSPNEQGGGGSTTPLPGGNKSAAGGGATPINEGGNRGTSTAARNDRRAAATPQSTTTAPARHYMAGSGSVAFNPGVNPWNGFSSTMSSLTLQPFEEPIVSVPAYGIPGAAAGLVLDDPVAAPPASAQPETHATTGFSAVPASSNATPTDIPAWLLATSTGLLMLVAAGHFVRATTRNMVPES